jgi:4-amino-4-deoxy-L-arabinose transferase-like glycosyltransferase
MGKSNMREKIHLIPPGILILVTAWLRLANLGYSDYQGDEVKALAGPIQGQSLTNFLLEQRKGPVQFILTYLINLAHPSQADEFLTRLPFAIAGILSIYFFYRLVFLLYGKKIAIYAALLLSINGLFVGLTRIIQYQPLVILFSVLALYCITLALDSPRWSISGLYLGMFFWAAAILSHYDGVFIAPFALYLLGRWYAANTEIPATSRRRHLVVSAGLGVLLLAAFFIPFFIELRNSTIEYWLLRFTGEGEPTGTPSSLFTFQLYNPLFALYLYIFLGGMSLLRIRMNLPIWLWFLFPWLILEGIIADPGTHIYTYILPATILVGFGFSVLEGLVRRLVGERSSFALVVSSAALAITFLSAVSHLIFIDHTPEYPWEQRRILYWTIGAPDEKYRVWAFGFPYNRQWEAIGEYITSNENNEYYATNENKSLAGNYIPIPFDVNRSGYYIHIYHPQSFRDRLVDDKIRYWTKNYPPVKTYLTEGKTVAEIYDMPPGNISELRSQGY